MRIIFTNIFKFMLGAFIAFCLFEITLGVIASSSLGKVFPVIAPELGQPDKDIGYAFKPDNRAIWPRENRAFVEINKLGLRDSPISTKKEEGAYRVALVGDSVVEALQVENHYVFDALAEKSLRAKGENIEILNFAMAGNGPLRQLVRLEKFAVPLDIDMSVLLMSASDFLTQELRDDSGNPAYKIDKNKNVERSYGFRNRLSQRYADSFIGQAFMSLMHYSSTFRMLYYKKSEGVLKIMGVNFDRDVGMIKPFDACHMNSIKSLYDFWVIQDRSDPNWLITRHYFYEVSQYGANNGPVLLGMYIPVPQDDCNAQLKQRSEIIRFLDDLLKKQDIKFVDWNHEALRYLPPKMALKDLHGFGLKLGNGHLNYKGHEIYATVLEDIIFSYSNKSVR